MYFSRVPCKLLYARHKLVFDNTQKILIKHNIDILKYVKFCVLIENMHEQNIDEQLLSINMIIAYAEYCKNIEHQKVVYDAIMRTATFIASQCDSLNIMTSKKYILHLISHKKLGAYVISGKISKYFLAAIPNFDKVINSLDYFSKIDLSDLQKLFIVYCKTANDAFMTHTNKKLNPFGLADDIIKQNHIKKDHNLFDENL